MNLLATKRRCGSCTACCVPRNDAAPCSCGSEPSRTTGCRGFECLWSMGLGRRTDRPDQLGVLFAPEVSAAGEPGVWAFELAAGAAQSARSLELVRKLSKKLPVIVAEHVPVAPGVGIASLTLVEPPPQQGSPRTRSRGGPLLAGRVRRGRRRGR